MTDFNQNYLTHEKPAENGPALSKVSQPVTLIARGTNLCFDPSLVHLCTQKSKIALFGLPAVGKEDRESQKRIDGPIGN